MLDPAALFGELAVGMSALFGGPYHAGNIVAQGTPGAYDDDGNFLTGAPPTLRGCLVQVDAATWAMRNSDDFVEGTVRLIIPTASFEGSLNTDATVEVFSGPNFGVWSVTSTDRDPLGTYWECRGRLLSAEITRFLAGTVSAAATISGEMSLTAAFAGNLSATGALTGTLAGYALFGGTVAASSALSGTITGTASLAGTVAAASTLSGAPQLYTAETRALLARMSVQPDDTRKARIDILIQALKTAGVWAKLDCLYLLAAHDAQAARLNWISTSFNAAAVASPTFVTDRGYTGDGSSSYLTTGFQPGVSSGLCAQDSNHFGVWCRTNVSGSGVDMGHTNCSLNSNSSGNLNARNMAGTTDVVSGVGTSIGHTIHTRSGAAGFSRYKNAASLGDATRASVAPSALGLFICCSNAGGAPASYSTRQIAAAHVGAALSAGEVTALYNAIAAYMTAIGA